MSALTGAVGTAAGNEGHQPARPAGPHCAAPARSTRRFLLDGPTEPYEQVTHMAEHTNAETRARTQVEQVEQHARGVTLDKAGLRNAHVPPLDCAMQSLRRGGRQKSEATHAVQARRARTSARPSRAVTARAPKSRAGKGPRRHLHRPKRRRPGRRTAPRVAREPRRRTRGRRARRRRRPRAVLHRMWQAGWLPRGESSSNEQ